MANTVKQEGLTVTITDIDSDWAWTDLSPAHGDSNGVNLSSIQFDPVQVADKCVVKEKDDSSPEMFYALCENAYDQKIKYFHGQLKRPVLDFTAGVFTAGTRVIIELWEPLN